jgi:crotonobetainyl-CoA:carnitine CoA-transferase CaiB-like acyl-CoA transferase
VGLLEGVRVLDLTIWRPGPYATQLLADFGADVIKVEPPGGDPMRVYGGVFATLHANKRSIELDLKQPDDRRRALELAAEADVVIEGFRPGVAARLGVGYDDVQSVNGRVVYCSLSGYGQTGDLVALPGHDLNYQAWAGVLAPDGGEPIVPEVPIADLAGGMAAAFAVCAAVVRQGRTGEGEHIDVAMADVLATWTGAVTPRVERLERDPDNEGGDREEDDDRVGRGVAGYGTFRTADEGHLTLGVLTEDHFWSALCDALQLPDVRDLPFAARSARVDELQTRLRASIAQGTRDELVAALMELGVPVAPVLDRAEMVARPHFRERHAVLTDAPGHRDGPTTGFVVQLANHPPRRHTPAPTIDEHRGATFRPRP